MAESVAGKNCLEIRKSIENNFRTDLKRSILTPQKLPTEREKESKREGKILREKKREREIKGVSDFSDLVKH